MKYWVLPHREVSVRFRRWLLALAMAGGGLGGWLAVAQNGTIPYQIRMLCVFVALGAAAVVDLLRKKIPNGCPLAILAAVGMCTALDIAFAPESALSLIAGELVGGLGMLACLLLCRLISRGGIGVGDIKLVSAIGLAMGLYGSVLVLLCAQAAAVVAAVILLASKRADWKDSVPFAPFLWVGMLVQLALYNLI